MQRDEQQEICQMYGVENITRISYEDIIQKYIKLLQGYAYSPLDTFTDIDYFNLINKGCRFLLNTVILKTQDSDSKAFLEIEKYTTYKLFVQKENPTDFYEQILWDLEFIKKRAIVELKNKDMRDELRDGFFIAASICIVEKVPTKKKVYYS